MMLNLRSSYLSRSLARGGSLPLVLLLMIVLAGCSSSNDKDAATPTPVPPTPTLTALAVTVAPTKLNTEGQIISDGLCQASLPDDWVDDTTGRGTTASGAKYALFGGRVRSDDAWNEAVDLVKTQANSRPGSAVSDGDNFVRVDLADNRGFEYRARFDTLYCDFSVTAAGGAVPDDERALWDDIIASLGPASD